uniref:Uncharacterized protein n=1 Tax=Tanacetum cinerariifolium TaxID=118510 RepID=A0A6L2MHS7_TANCI|nr:hypothetical protein [Tanacetum cinerariifolium]
MITTTSKMEGRKPSRLMKTMDIMDLISSVGNVQCITQDHALSGVKIATKTISSSDHSTSNNEDAFSSNIPDYVSTIPDYSPASSGKTYSNALNNSTGEKGRVIDPTEMSEEDVQNMLKIVLVAEFKVEALQVKVSGITQAYQSFEDMLKDFSREDLDALWGLVKERFSTAVPTFDKEKALWVELKRLFEPDADDVIWKLQKYMHYPIIWKLHSNYRVHQVSSITRRHHMYMLAEKDYLLSD